MLEGRLYRWNALPDTPAWRRRLPHDRAVRDFLDVDRAVARTGLAEEPGLRSAWREWSRRESGDRGEGTTYKLYLSPTPSAIPAALARLVPLLPRLPALLGFKLPRERAALLRPDKILLYFPTLEDLRTAARRLAPALQGVPAHGVPFSAALDDAGLLSWGADPPEADTGDEFSWREWLCRHLARSLVLAELSGAPPASPARFALDRLARDGVDVATWSPVPGRWAPAAMPDSPAAGTADGAH